MSRHHFNFLFYITMSKKNLLLGVLALSVLTVFGVSQVSAYRGDYSAVGPNHTEERGADMEKVMEQKDYEGWKKLMTEDGRTRGVLNKIDSPEDFNKFAEAYELAHEGKTEEANAIRSELGLGNGQRGGRQGKGGNFVDANGNGVCDRAE